MILVRIFTILVLYAIFGSAVDILLMMGFGIEGLPEWNKYVPGSILVYRVRQFFS